MSRSEKRTPPARGANATTNQPTNNGNCQAAEPSAQAAEYWSARIHAAHAASVEAILQTGRELMAAKAKLSHGEWGRLTGETTREPLLPFSSQTAQKLMKIAANPVISDPARCAGFPASWGTLAVLAQLPGDVLEQYVATGVIHPDITRTTAEELVDELRVQQSESAAPKANTEPKQQAKADADRAAREAQDAWERAEAARRAAKRDRRREQHRAFADAFGMGIWLISRGDFKLVLGCLHPDQQAPERQDRYTKAFQIFKRLEPHIVDRGPA